MASYVVNPSKKVSEILSKFLEFDPKQLQLGLWSGDLSISNVNLKCDAFDAFLNPPSKVDGDAISALHLKLVSGKVGDLRVQIPWKRLVWGEGAVRLQVSDVDIVLEYESRDQTKKRLKSTRRLESRVRFEDDDEETEEVKEISDEERERKQNWLQEAEKRQLQGLSIPSSYDELYNCERNLESETVGEDAKEAGRVDSYLRKLTSSMMWRFVAGLQASIRNVRVVLVQDGIEIGVVQHTMEVKPGKQAGTTVVTEPTTSDATDVRNTDSGSASENDRSSSTGPLDDINEYEGEYEDGEHVDKTIDVNGLGVFLRRVPRVAPPVPLHLEFSHSVNPDDYVLRPASMTLALTFFYPHPPDKKRKKKAKEKLIASGNPTISSTGSSCNESAVTSATAKARRGKRVKVNEEFNMATTVVPSKRAKNLLENLGETPSRDNLHPSVREEVPIAAESSTCNTKPRSVQRKKSVSLSHHKPNSLLPPMTELYGSRPAIGSVPRVSEGRSVSIGTKTTHGNPENVPSLGSVVSPHLELHLSLGEVRTVYSSRHHHYSMIVLRSLQHMRRGRPGERIKDHLNEGAREPIRSIMVETPLVPKKAPTEVLARQTKIDSNERSNFGTPSPSFTFHEPSPSILSPGSTPGLSRSSSLSHYQTRNVELKLHFTPKSNGEKQRVVMSWWDYVYKNVLLEVRARKKKRDKFNPYSFKFDWDAIKRRRQEYINLYLRQSASFATFAIRGRNDEETMRKIEDELHVEQILLYRSIARALHVRGIQEMGDTVIALHDRRYLKDVKRGISSNSQNKMAVRRAFTSQSTGEFAVNEVTLLEATNSLPSVKDYMTIDTLRHVSAVARDRRDIASRSTQAAHRNGVVANLFQSPVQERQESGAFASAASLKKPGIPDGTGPMSRSGGSDARTFKTAVTSYKLKTGKDVTSSVRTNSLRFSLTFNLEMFRLLLLNDVQFARSFEECQVDETSDLQSNQAQDRNPVTGDSSQPDDATSDDISYLTDDGNFPESSSLDQNGIEEMESGPILSSEDFLAFGEPGGVVLDLSIAPLDVFFGGLSGGSKKVAFRVGNVSILGEASCTLVTAGSIISNDFGEMFSMQEILLAQNRKRSLGRGLPTGGDKEAIRACLLIMENQENFLEVDLARIVFTAELEALAALRRFFSTTVTFPLPLIADNELDIVREYLLDRSKGTRVLEGVDCALRCHGFDVVIPSDASECSDELHPPITIKRGGRLRAAVTLVECYSGSLVEHIYMSANEHQDSSSRFSGSKSKSSGFASSPPHPSDQNIEQGLKLLDICTLYDQQRTMSSEHAIAKVSGLHFSIEIPSLAERNAIEVIPLQRAHVDIETFLTSVKAEGLVGGHIELSVAVSPLAILVSKRRRWVMSEILAHVARCRSQSEGSAGNLARHLEPPRLEALSEHKVASGVLSISGVAVILVGDEGGDHEISFADQEIIVEAAISDYLSFLACFDLQHPVDDAILLSRSICIERLVGAGFEVQNACDCVESARRRFLDDIKLVETTQMQTLHEVANIKRGYIDPRLAASTLDLSVGEHEADSPLDDDSQESFDILETALRNAVEQTLSSYLHLSQLPPKAIGSILVVEAGEGVNAKATKLFYDSHLTVEMPSLTLRNGAGLEIASLIGSGDGPTYCSNNSQFQRDQFNSKPEEPLAGLLLSVFNQDKGFDFAAGGSALSVLGRDSLGTVVRHRECLVDGKLGKLKVHVCSKVLIDVLHGLGELTNNIEPGVEKRGSDAVVPSNHNNRVATEMSLCVDVEGLSLVLLSDEMNPFSNLTFLSVLCTYTTSLVIEANDMSLVNLTPEGQYFPMAVQRLTPEEKRRSVLGVPVIRLLYSFSPAPWKICSNVLIEVDGVQIVFLNQFISDLTQFFASANHGIGRLLSLLDSKVPVDDYGNPPPPLMLRILVSDSSLLLPRSSTSMDMLAIEFTSMDISKSYHVESFKLANATGSLRKGEAWSCNGAHSEDASEMLASVIEFYDCIETAGAGPLLVSSFEKDLLLRFTITLKDANIFTALPPDGTKSTTGDAVNFLRKHCISRPTRGKNRVFEPRVLVQDDTLQRQPKHVWECITQGAASLEILADFTPNLRLLITDDVTGAQSPSSVNLDARMSQFYLLLSVWYGNMQELPTLFPQSAEIIQRRALHKEPPSCFPDYGSEEYVEWLLKAPPTFSTEIACHFVAVSMHCGFDPSGYFAVDPASLNMLPEGSPNEAFSISLEECIVHVTSDEHAIMRIGCGAKSFQVLDQRKALPFNEFVRVEGPCETSTNIWADLSFGLQLDGNDLESGALAMPFQATVFMTPGWTLVNLGVERLSSVMANLTPVWIILDYFSKYFSSEAFGNPYFEAVSSKETLKRKLESAAKCNRPSARNPTLNLEFRLWLLRPMLCIPSDTTKIDAPTLRVKSNSGFWYRFKSLDSYTSQEMGSTNLSIQFSSEFQTPDMCRDGLSWRDTGIHNRAKQLVDGLSFGLRVDLNGETKHADYALCLPMWQHLIDKPTDRCRVSSSELEVRPVELPRPTVCTPATTIKRDLGMSFCEITVVVEVLPQASTIIFAFLGLGTDADDELTNADLAGNEEDSTISPEPSFTINARVESLRFFIIDPTLGVHLPLAVFSLSILKLSISRLGIKNDTPRLSNGDSHPSDLHLIVETTFWADYFKLGATRSWEPLIEPFVCLILYEKSVCRGEGLTLNSDHPFHVNVTGALLLTLEDAIASLSRAVAETFVDAKFEKKETKLQPMKEKPLFVEQVLATGDRNLEIDHQVPEPLNPDERIAFSLMNLTGQRIRIHQLLERIETKEHNASLVTYLEHSEATRLELQATVSVIQNLHLVEVPFPGLPHSPRETGSEVSTSHSVDIQLPGFKWIEGISVDTSGRRFDHIVPRSPVVQSKVSNDWRLGNTMKFLTEVGIDNGGRVITVRSLFEVRNHTTHSICVHLHPDPMHTPASIDPGNVDPDLSPGEALQVPILLLEAALRFEGKHLGCLWVRPSTTVSNEDLLRTLYLEKGASVENPTIGFSSRPVQLAKVVLESALLFQEGNGEDIPPDKARSGIQLSCPIADGGDSVPVAPFCYAIEVRRSPIVRTQSETRQPPGKKVNFGMGGINRLGSQMNAVESRRARKRRETPSLTHIPIAYTLIVHPPIVIENLLPAFGRFELMHATRRTVLWFSDLKPGETVSVHTVGLDAPLLLLINLGFCKTPVGEGALVHHGSDLKGSTSQAGLKSLGKAVTMGTKQIGKTLTTMAESPDRRGKGKLFLLQNPQYHRGTTQRKKNNTKTPGAAAAESLGLDADIGSIGQIHLIDERIYNADETATETVVVDGVGQKLTLKIENIRGGGGQRRISLFCPFWMVNTTEHALRYKQEKSSSFVAGTVCSPSCDGSKTVDGSRRNLQRRMLLRSRVATRHLDTVAQRDARPADINHDTVFSGTPGAIATFPGRPQVSKERLAKLLQRDLPLEDLASIAFMFNFHEDALLIGHQRLSVQLADGTGLSPFTSDWSHGFSLETIGVPQLVGMHCRDGRVLELSVTISVAPAFLSRYTKIVRFTPRYILVNRLDQPIRIWQDSSLLHPVLENRTSHGGSARKDNRKWRFRPDDEKPAMDNNYANLFGGRADVEDVLCEGEHLGTTAHKLALYIATVGPNELVPFHLPDTRGDRQFRVDLGGSWDLSPSFDADVSGEHTFLAQKSLDLRLLRHVNTRASPHYKVTFPPVDGSEWDGELGVWFETAWGGDRKILVKGTKRGRYAFNNTDIRVGDQLLQVDNIPVAQLTFAETMKLLKERLASVAIGRRNDLASPQRGQASLRNWKQRKSSRTESMQDIGKTSDDADDEAAQVVLTFRTLEERLRRVRVKASRTKQPRQHLLGDDDAEGVASSRETETENDGIEETKEVVRPHMKVEMRAIHNSIFVVVRELSSLNPPYRIENRAINHFIFFRQRGCLSYPWNMLQPGESTVYCWEEPTKSHKLTVRVGTIDNRLGWESSEGEVDRAVIDGETASEIDIGEKRAARNARWKQSLSFHNVDGEDQAGFGAAITVKLEEIGFECELPCPRRKQRKEGERALNCIVDANGTTRVLVISNNEGDSDDEHVLQRHVNALRKAVRDEKNRISELQLLRSSARQSQGVLKSGGKDNLEFDLPANSEASGSTVRLAGIDSHMSRIENEATALADFPEDRTIWRRHQIVIEVLEAAGLSSADATRRCNPYCEILLKGSKRSKSLFSSPTTVRKTYFVEGTFSPKWIDQAFVFDVPPAAVEYTRDHMLQVRIRGFRFIGQHPYLGQTNVHLRSLRNQEELVGWYPLVGRTGPRDLEDSNANWGRGSVKLRVQWIYTVPALVSYFLMLSENRLRHFERSLHGMRAQLESLMENEASGNQLKKQEITKEILKDPFGVATRLLARRNPQNRLNLPPALKRDRVETNEGISVWPLTEPMKTSRDKLLWLFQFQTLESRRARKASWSSEQENSVMPTEPQQAVPVVIARGDLQAAEDGRTGLEVDQSASVGGSSLILDQYSTANARGEYPVDALLGPTVSENDLSSRTRWHSPRSRSLSLEDIRRSMEVLELTKRGVSLLGGDTMSFDEFGTRSMRSGGIDITSSIEGATERSIAINALLQMGFLYHDGRSTFHRDHLTYNFRLGLLAGMRPKSRQRVSLSDGRFKTWLIAMAVLNDSDVMSQATENKFEFSLGDPKPHRRVTLQEPTNPTVISSSACITDLVKKIGLPRSAPIAMRMRLSRRAEELGEARVSFDRVCKKSLKVVLHPGGWLIVRPLTVLNLPPYPGMSVKVRFGSLTLASTTVDARVTPIWGNERLPEDAETPSSPRKNQLASLMQNRRGKSEQPRGGELEDDLVIPIDPQKTSGSIRLAVIGERLNSKIELGVLDIPLGPAIRCCMEEMETDVELEDADLDQLEYVRWFPLMNPKGDSNVIEGDMGYGGRPLDTEQATDTHFGQYFSPCIKLALLWCPSESDSAIDQDSQGCGLRAGKDDAAAPPSKVYFNADIARISASLINSQIAVELLALSVSDIAIRYFVSTAKTRIGFVVGWIQVDHQLEGTKEPVMLAPTPVVHPGPTLQFLVYKDNARSKGKIQSFELIAFYMEELDLTIEESWVLDMTEFFVSIVRRREVKKRALNFQSTMFFGELIKTMKFAAMDDNIHQSLLEVLWEDDSSEAKTYIENLYLGPVRVNLTYLKGRRAQTLDSNYAASYMTDIADGIPDVLSAVGISTHRVSQQSEIFTRWTEFTHDEDLWTEMGQGKNLPNILASVLPSVSEAPIRLQGKSVSFVFEDTSEIFNSLKNYYTTETLKQIYKIVGSLDFVGNPVMLLSSLATGVRDFFVAPSKEFLKSPKNPSRLGLGVAKGTLSLFAHSASGLFGFAAKMSATAAQATAIFSFDSDYQQWHRDHVLAEAKNLDRHWKRRGVGGISRIFTRPIIDLIRGVVLGSTGLVVTPIKSARKNGLSGLVRGVGVGAVGVLAKPAVGILDAISHFSGSIHDVAKSVNVLDKRYQPAKRLRLPYAFSVRNVLIPFNPITARSVRLLKKFPVAKMLVSQGSGKIPTLEMEVHVASEIFSVESGVETFVIISTFRVVLVKVKRDGTGVEIPTLCWEVPLTTRANVSSRITDQGHNGVALTIVVCSPRSKGTNQLELQPSSAKELLHTPIRGMKDVDGADSETFPIDDIGDDVTHPPRSQQSHDGVSMQAQLETTARGKSNADGDASTGEAQLHHTILAHTGELIDFFTVLAEFHHRRQLCRLHNAICCMSGNMKDIILDRGIGTTGGTEGYSSFGEFYFTETAVPTSQSFGDRADDLELVPWVTNLFFETVGHKSTVDVNEEFVKMRREWNLEKEMQASEAFGGPKWLVKARAEAIFVPEQAPDIPSNLAHVHALEHILKNLSDGLLSYEEAKAEVERAVELIDIMSEGENHNYRDHGVSRSPVERSSPGDFFDLGLYSSCVDESHDVFSSAVGSLIKSSADVGQRGPLVCVEDLEVTPPREQAEDDIVPTSQDNEERGQCSQSNEESGSGGGPWNQDAVVAGDNRSASPDPIAGTLSSTESEGLRVPNTTGQNQVNSELRMERLEVMLEKLLEVSIVNAQQHASMSQERSEETLIAVQEELANLKAAFERQQKREDERVNLLREEITELHDQLGRVQVSDTRYDSDQDGNIQSTKVSEKSKDPTAKATKALMSARRKVFVLFRKSKRNAMQELPSILDDEDYGDPLAEDDDLGLDDLEVAQEGLGHQLVS